MENKIIDHIYCPNCNKQLINLGNKNDLDKGISYFWCDECNAEIDMKNSDMLNQYYEMKRKETRIKNKQIRDLVKVGGYENSEGRFCMEEIYPDGRTKHTPPILDITRIRMVKKCSQKGVKYQIFWNEDKTGFEIKEKDFSADKISQILKLKGHELKISRTRKTQAKEQLLNFLKALMTEKEVPCYYGWNKLSTGWYFNKNLEEDW